MSVKMSSASRQISRSDASNVPWAPDEDDTSVRAIDWRSRRGMRIAVETRDSLGHPTTRNLNGTIDPATGIWSLLEPMKEMADDWSAQKKMRSGIAGFLAMRGERILDRVLLMVLVAAVGYLSRHYWLPTQPLPVPPPTATSTPR